MPVCTESVSVFREPAGGWAGTEVSHPAVSIFSGGPFAESPQGADLFLTGGQNVGVYQVTGNYGTPAHRPLASHAALSGLRSGKPRLELTIMTQAEDPSIQALTLRLPRGLAFTRNRARLCQAGSVAHANPNPTAHGAVLTIRQVIALSTLKISIPAPALTETDQLKALIRRRAAHHKHTSLTLTARATPTIGTTATLVLRLRVS